MKLTHLPEPPLEFGGAFRHPDIRFGIMDHGPFDFGMEGAPKRIRFGIVGSADTVEGTARWVERCATGFPAKDSRQPNLFPPFPGTGFEESFRCEFVTSDELQAVLPPREIARLAAIPGQREMTRAVVQAIADEIGALSERSTRPDVVLVALPIEIIQRTYNARDVVGGDDADAVEAGANLDFRGMLKAACMRIRIPIQLLAYDVRSRVQDSTQAEGEQRPADPGSGDDRLESAGGGLLQGRRSALAPRPRRPTAPHLLRRVELLPVARR